MYLQGHFGVCFVNDELHECSVVSTADYWTFHVFPYKFVYLTHKILPLPLSVAA